LVVKIKDFNKQIDLIIATVLFICRILDVGGALPLATMLGRSIPEKVPCKFSEFSEDSRHDHQFGIARHVLGLCILSPAVIHQSVL